MANEEQLSILKHGVKAWNEWREENFAIEVDLRRANLTKANLKEIDLRGAYLANADLAEANLTAADIRHANLREADLSGACFVRANLSKANFIYAVLDAGQLQEASLAEADLRKSSLRKAYLIETSLWGANLSSADLTDTDFTRADLDNVDFSGADFSGADFYEARLGNTIFALSDLSQVKRLETVVHSGPSRISTEIFAYSNGEISEIFLKGCGLSDWEIESVKLYKPGLTNEEINKILYRIYDLRATQAVQISPLFISYGHADNEFVDKVGDGFSAKGVRYWRDIHEMKAGRMETQIDRAIRQNPTVLLVLSEHSLSSDWVEHEVRTARALEKDIGRDVLCPVALDDSWKDSRWPKRLMEQIMEYNILDFPRGRMMSSLRECSAS